MAHDTCLQSAFSTGVGISGYCIMGGMQTWQKNKEPSSTSLAETSIFLSKQYGLPQRKTPLQWRQRLKWSICPSITNCLLRTEVREVEPFLRFSQCKLIKDALLWVTKDFLRVCAELGVGGPIISFDKISTLVCFACMTCLTTLCREEIHYRPSPQLLALSYTDMAAYLICRKVQSV